MAQAIQVLASANAWTNVVTPTQASRVIISESVSDPGLGVDWLIAGPVIETGLAYKRASDQAVFDATPAPAVFPALATVAWIQPLGLVGSATITGFSIAASSVVGVNIVTFQAANSFRVGQAVQIAGLSIGTYLNGQVLFISTVTPTSFSADVSFAAAAQTTDSGTAVLLYPFEAVFE